MDNLEPRSPLLNALANRPFAPRVEYHSIIGVRHPKWPAPFQGDLVVPYRSAHLAGAESEMVLPVTHFCKGRPEVVAELERILRAHAGLGTGPVIGDTGEVRTGEARACAAP